MKEFTAFSFSAVRIAEKNPHLEQGMSGTDKILYLEKNSEKNTFQVELPFLPENCCGIKLVLQLAGEKEEKDVSSVFSYQFRQGEKILDSHAVRYFVSGEEEDIFVTLDACILMEADKKAFLIIKRCVEDEADSFQKKCRIKALHVTPLQIREHAVPVTDIPGYNSWSMCQQLQDKTVCTYCRGVEHDVFEPQRAVYAKVSRDGGENWEEETLVCNTPERGDSTIGKGLDENGRMLLWVRHAGKNDGFRHRLYRTEDGKKFEKICEQILPLDVVQITDIIHIPQKGLFCLFFGGPYGKNSDHYWGKLESKDNGASWKSTIIEKDLDRNQWPTEPSAVYLGDGKILVIARTEQRENSTAKAQFQITSCDYGNSWKKAKTNMTDIHTSTPSLVYDRKTNLVSCYYYYRKYGTLNRRTINADQIFSAPLHWPSPECIAIGSTSESDAGNVNATVWGNFHILSYYSGTPVHTDIFIKKVPAPEKIVSE